MNKEKFKFELGADVAIAASGERGTVRGRAQYVQSEDSYYVLYRNAVGIAVEAWWPESTLTEPTAS
jgi:hypothetical protein